MKTIGLIGGMSWESTLLYYQTINREVSLRLGGLHSAKVLMHSLDFEEVVKGQKAGDWAGLARLLGEAAQGLSRAGADVLLICTNTMHKIAEDVVCEGMPPLLHIADVTGQAIRAHPLHIQQRRWPPRGEQRGLAPGSATAANARSGLIR